MSPCPSARLQTATEQLFRKEENSPDSRPSVCLAWRSPSCCSLLVPREAARRGPLLTVTSPLSCEQGSSGRTNPPAPCLSALGPTRTTSAQAVGTSSHLVGQSSLPDGGEAEQAPKESLTDAHTCRAAGCLGSRCRRARPTCRGTGRTCEPPQGPAQDLKGAPRRAPWTWGW